VYRIGAAILLAATVAGATVPLTAQELLSADEEELVAREKVRSAVETALTNYIAAGASEKVGVALDGISLLEPFGETVIPYLANELEQERSDNFDFIAYALGLLNFPGSEEALLHAIDRAEDSPGAAALARKAWACWALGLHGNIEGFDRVNTGRHRSGQYPIHASTTVLEAIALQTAPECVPKLLVQYDEWGQSEDEERRGDRRWVLRALRRVGDPAAVAKLAAIAASDEDPSFRAQAALALRSMETEASIDALLAGLGDEDPLVRRASAYALEWMMPPIDADLILDVLDDETDTKTRGALYGVAATTARADQVTRLLAHGNQPDPADRRLFLNAVGDLEHGDLGDTIAVAIDDPSNTVALTAIGVLADSGTPADRQRLFSAFETTTNPTAVQLIAEISGTKRWAEFAPIATRRLLSAASLAGAERPGIRNTVDKLARSLVDQRYTAALSKLRRARKSVDDSIVAASIDRAITLLDLLRKNGKATSKWIALAESPSTSIRRLAWERLVELGGDDAARTVVGAFDGADDADRWEILLLLERFDTAETRKLIRQVLLGPEIAQALRDQAAWIARTIGGPQMSALLEHSIVLRDGRDAKVMAYAAALTGESALPLLKEYRLIRMRYLAQARGKEQEALDWIASQLERGRQVERYDRPPAKLVFR
jgi:HEAT repeat protein